MDADKVKLIYSEVTKKKIIIKAKANQNKPKEKKKCLTSNF